MTRSPLLLYDGACGFCARQVQFILRHDRRRVLSFAPLEGVTAPGIIARHPELKGVDSLVWVDEPGGTDERARVRSGAVLAIASYLGGVWRLGLVLAIIPGGWRDGLYDVVARHRHRLAGSDCIVPMPDEADRFLD
ncbi:MAG TPA: DCC1-like thiol-disulfide oxidoreductase family protein [Gemmatimonadales bacterium]|nr:DCC1-like thiol-disulfide oxidoreductase family protein [Gemmatimonadales bacterium]